MQISVRDMGVPPFHANPPYFAPNSAFVLVCFGVVVVVVVLIAPWGLEFSKFWSVQVAQVWLINRPAKSFAELWDEIEPSRFGNVPLSLRTSCIPFEFDQLFKRHGVFGKVQK